MTLQSVQNVFSNEKRLCRAYKMNFQAKKDFAEQTNLFFNLNF